MTDSTRSLLEVLVRDDMADIRKSAALSVRVHGYVCGVFSRRLARLHRALRELRGKEPRILKLEDV